VADSDPNVQRRRLKNALREHREQAGITQREAAATLDWSLSKLIRIEAGAHGVSVTDLQALLNLYGVTERGVTASLKELARASRGKPWWHEYRDIVSPQFATYLGHESSASGLTAFHPFMLPGLLHTEAYATTVLSVLRDPERTDRIVKLRVKRQQQLFADQAVRLVFLVNEEALYRWIGGRDVMRNQLEHIRDIADRPNTEVKIVPFSAGAHPGLLGSFTVVRIDDHDLDERLVFLESMNGDQLIRDDREHIERYESYAAELCQCALSREDGDALLKEQIQRLELAPTRACITGTAARVTRKVFLHFEGLHAAWRDLCWWCGGPGGYGSCRS
jgi:transcriptional regulator with XRE-family HTH domain